MKVPKVKITDGYYISRIIKGNWQLAGGHGKVDVNESIENMVAFFDAGIDTFDCADIYTGVEELLGKFVTKIRSDRGRSAADSIHIHTKYVPNLNSLPSITTEDVSHSILASIRKLQVERIDLLQFHWWDYKIKNYVEVAHALRDLQNNGYIRHIGVTNFNTKTLRELKTYGINVVSHQTQYSLLDKRPEKQLATYCSANRIPLLAYGVLAGGLLNERFINEPISMKLLRQNRSYTKYKAIIDDIGGNVVFVKLLEKLKEIALSIGCTIEELSIAYILNKQNVTSAIIGARNNSHITSLVRASNLILDSSVMSYLDSLVSIHALKGDVYDIERSEPNHKNIMKYNLNKESI